MSQKYVKVELTKGSNILNVTYKNCRGDTDEIID